MRHRCQCAAFLCRRVDSLEASLLLQSHLLSIDADATEVWHAIGLESWSSALDVNLFLLLLLFLHPDFFSLPEAKGSFALFRDLDRLLLDAKATLLVGIHDLLVSRDQDRCWNRLMTELMLYHVLFFHLLFHDHLVDFFLPDVCFGVLSVASIEVERFGDSNTIAALSVALCSQPVHVIVTSDALAA